MANPFAKYNKEYILQNKDKFFLTQTLYYFDYTEEELISMIGSINLYIVVKTQKLSLNFIKNYILNEELYELDIETCINVDFIKHYQNYTIDEISA